MASIYDLKPKFQALLRPIVQSLAHAGATPNQVTLAALALSAAEGLAIGLSGGSRVALLLLPLILFVRMALNAIDGMLAREHNMRSSLGGILNELGDVVSDAALYLPLGLAPGLSLSLMAWIVVLAVISEMAGLLGLTLGGTRRYDGPMGKSDRAFVFGALGLAFGLGAPPGRWSILLLGIVLLLECATIVNRARRALNEGSHR